MSLIVYSKSRSFEDHIQSALNCEMIVRSTLTPPIKGTGDVYLVHAASFQNQLIEWLNKACDKSLSIGIASDQPNITEMLTLTEIGVRAYFNSHMAPMYYDQLHRLLQAGQSWFPPALLNEVFGLARSVAHQSEMPDSLEILTKREKEIAIAVSEGKSNKVIATDCNITERTVKSHLTHIFKKLKIKDRVSLVIYLNQAGHGMSGTTSITNT